MKQRWFYTLAAALVLIPVLAGGYVEFRYDQLDSMAPDISGVLVKPELRAKMYPQGLPSNVFDHISDPYSFNQRGYGVFLLRDVRFSGQKPAQAGSGKELLGVYTRARDISGIEVQGESTGEYIGYGRSEEWPYRYLHFIVVESKDLARQDEVQVVFDR